MPSIIHAKIVLEGRSESVLGTGIPVDVTCVRGLLEDVSQMHSVEFQSAFGSLSIKELMEEWRNNGLLSGQVPLLVEKFRKAAFEADNLGEAAVEFRNKNELPDIAPGVALVFCAILDYLAGSCGVGGVVRFVVPGESQ